MTEQIGKVVLDLTHYAGEDKYCDGAVEDELLEIVRTRTVEEYQEVIEERASWPILYHLSSLRENIVDWIPMDKNMKVLEVGSGCGAVTGAFSKKAGEVTCVDLSKKRSMINAHRHSECDNITIHVGNFKDIEPSLPCDYDYICLIGVFEYGQGYIGGPTPFETFLDILKKHMAPGGRIVIAIENKFGMKYFAGCKEDHLGTYFSGIENYPEGGGVRTFTRKGLEKIFAACQIPKYAFYYPYPDYKFMTTLYSDAYLPDKGELSNNMRNFDRDRMVLFDEKKAFDGTIEDGLFPLFSNSYLAIIGERLEVKYARFSNDRAKEYRIRTEICRDENGRIEVKKHPLCKESEEHIRALALAYKNLKQRYDGGNLAINHCELHEEKGKLWASFEFILGNTLSELLDACLDQNDIDGFHALFRQYVEKIGYNQTYPVSDFDMVFSNIIVKGEKWTVIDYEWTFGKEVQAKELAYRAIYCYLLEDEKRKKLNLNRVFEELGLTEEEAKYFQEQELDFQKFVTGKRKSMSELREMIGNKQLYPGKWIDKLEDDHSALRVQIYEDRGNGYSEETSYFLPEAYRNENLIEAEIILDDGVSMLRIDPAMEACMIKIKELKWNGVLVPLQGKRLFVTNGKILKDTGKNNTSYEPSIVFPTQDPNLNIRMSELQKLGLQKENTLWIQLEVAMLPLGMAQNLSGAVKKNL